MVNEVRRKRRKLNNIDRLFDELLMEVLCRLPCSKTAVMCKSVCKRWSALVSQPHFVSRFVAHKASCKITNCAHDDDEVSKYDQTRLKLLNDRTFGLVVRRECVKTWTGLMIRFNDPVQDRCSLSFTPLPKLVNEGLPPSLTVVGAYNDLLLYQRHGCDDCKADNLELYITNAQTRQWLALPTLHLQRRTWQIGFICDPYYSSDVTNLIPNDAFRATIVVIDYTLGAVSKFRAHLLSPHTKGVWRNVVLSLPVACQLLGYSALFCVGSKLYVHCRGGIVGFDPFVDDKVIKCLFIKTPSMVSTTSFCGVFHEQLYMCDREDNGRFRVWILRDYKTGKWSLRHSVVGQDWIPLDSRLSKLVNQKPCFGRAVGFHPTDADVIYVLTRSWVVMCNLATRKMEIVSNLPKFYQDVSHVCVPVQITLPVWPTPLPNLLYKKHTRRTCISCS